MCLYIYIYIYGCPLGVNSGVWGAPEASGELKFPQRRRQRRRPLRRKLLLVSDDANANADADVLALLHGATSPLRPLSSTTTFSVIHVLV